MGRPPQPRARPVATTRPRYGRIAAAAGAVLVTVVATLGGAGVLPSSTFHASAAPRTGAVQLTHQVDSGAPTSQDAADRSATQSSAGRDEGPQASGMKREPDGTIDEVRAPLPADSGTGRRVVFGLTAQRVWLVDRVAGRDVVLRTYLVSGSLTDNLQPGTYSVYSRSLHAWGVDDSGSMRYMVRFAHGPNAAIGFHDIPVLDGHRVQTRDQLGSPQSHGCIRQARPDARALWRFAPTGTKVVVV